MTETIEMEVFMLISEPDFDEEKQQAFKEAISEAAGNGVRADHVIISKIEEMSMASRRLMSQGIRIAVIVNAEDRSAASAIAESLTEEAINNELQDVGLPSATLLQAAAVTQDSQLNVAGSPPPSSESGSPESESEEAGGVPVAVIGGGAAAALVVALAAAACCYMRQRKEGGSASRLEEGAPDISGIQALPIDPALKLDGSKVTLGQELGRGGSGVVMKGTLEQRRGGPIDVAVKLISMGDERQFANEVVNLIKASQNCSGVAKIYGVCQKNDNFCIVMKYYPKTLAQVLRENPKGLPTAPRIKYSKQLSQTLREMHDKGIAHRDFKPDNIFIDEHDSVIVGDFGIAKAYEATVAAGKKSTHVMAGTYNYMSPEAFDEDEFGKVSIKTDVWSLGACLLEMATGRPPYHDLRPAQIMNHVANLKRAPHVPAASPWASLLQGCFEFDQARRLNAEGLSTAVSKLEQDLLDGRQAEIAAERLSWVSDETQPPTPRLHKPGPTPSRAPQPGIIHLLQEAMLQQRGPSRRPARQEVIRPVEVHCPAQTSAWCARACGRRRRIAHEHVDRVARPCALVFVLH